MLCRYVLEMESMLTGNQTTQNLNMSETSMLDAKQEYRVVLFFASVKNFVKRLLHIIFRHWPTIQAYADCYIPLSNLVWQGYTM